MKETDITVDDWFKTWMEVYKKDSVKYGTYSLYQRTYRLYVQEDLGKIKLSDVRPEQIQHLYNSLNRAGYSQKTINLVSNVI